MFIQGEKMMPDTGDAIWFAAHKQLAKTFFHEYEILFGEQSDKVDWKSVHQALHEVSRLFQIWACKQVMRIVSRM